MQLSKDAHHRPIVFIRFNPDKYNNIKSCWVRNKFGICVVGKTRIEEWQNRLLALKQQIKYWTKETNTTNKMVEVIQLFYDTN